MRKNAKKPDDQEVKRRSEALNAIKDEVLILKTPLADERRTNGVHPVIGEGSHFADIMFVGEAPGKNEAIQARPFCGASGKFLTTLIESIGLKREDVYITNLVKDRPTDNRDPSPEEIKTYGNFLNRQIDIIQPKTIVLLGRYSMLYVMSHFGLSSSLEPISKMHGKDFVVPANELSQYAQYDRPTNVHVIPLYHPAVALYNGGMRATLLKDFEVIKTVL